METPLHYSALIFDSCQDENDSFENLKHDIDLFNQDPNCTQIIVNCLSEWQLKLALSPQLKTMLVQMATHPYVALVNGLKAVTEENVMVVGLSTPIMESDKKSILDALRTYPALYKHNDLQGFDTQLLMFCLQHTIEQNIAIDSYLQAVSVYGDTPIITLP